MTTRTPRLFGSRTSSTEYEIIRRGTAFMAGPPTGARVPGLVTMPTPSPRSSSSPCSSSHETRAVRWAPSVTSGSSPASLTTTASAHESPRSHRSTSNSTRRSRPFPATLHRRGPRRPLTALAAALAAAAAQVPVVQPVLSLWPLTFSMLGGMEGSRSLRGGISPFSAGFARRNMCENAGL